MFIEAILLIERFLHKNGANVGTYMAMKKALLGANDNIHPQIATLKAPNTVYYVGIHGTREELFRKLRSEICAKEKLRPYSITSHAYQRSRVLAA